MFTFRRLTIIFFITLLSLNLWNVFLGYSTGALIHQHANLLYGLLIFLYLGVSFTLAFMPCSGFHHRVICHATTNKKSVSVTFDDGPDPVQTPFVLETLKKHNIKATFFCIGQNLSGNEQLVKHIDAEGHLIGNHSFSHSNLFDLFSARKIRAELLETDLQIKNITGKSPLFFRPPFGVVNPMVSNALKNMHWQTICWNIRTLDTLNIEPGKIKRKILSKLKPGSIILLHDHSNFTKHHLDELLSAIIDAGYTLVPLDQLLKLPAYA